MPIDFQGHFDIAAKGGGKPVVLESAVIDFDRDGRLNVGGLPVCPVERVAQASTAQARQACAGAIVGSGEIGASIDLPDGNVTGTAPLTLFNGPRQDGNPTVILHAHTNFPATETFAIVVPIERRPGPFRYRATLVAPLDRRRPRRHHPRRRQGRPPLQRRRPAPQLHRRPLLRRRSSSTHGRFSFADGTIVDGSGRKALPGTLGPGRWRHSTRGRPLPILCRLQGR